MFKAFKTKGFNIEDTHLTDIDRIDKLVTVVSITFTLCTSTHKANCYQETKRKAHSFFKYGLKFITNALLVHFDQLLTFINVLSCT